MNVKIKGKLNLREIAHMGIALGLALVFGLVFYAIFAVLNMLSWLLVVFVVGLILTPIFYWGIKWYKEELDFDTTEADPEERPDCIRISDTEGK